jgi:oligopeptide transport system permease protein
VWHYIITRIGHGLIVLWLAVTLTFFLVRLLPGSPFTSEKGAAELNIELQKKYHLHGNLLSQYLSYWSDLFKGDLRVSINTYRDWEVTEILAQKLPNSLMLGSAAFLLSSLGGIFFGALSAWKKYHWQDNLLSFFTIFLLAIPTFITGPALMILFGLFLNWLPLGGWGSFNHLILPAFCLSLPYMAYITKLTRNSLLDVLSMDFMRTAKAKGLSIPTAIRRHALKLALLPVITYLGPLAANLLTGSMVIEAVFGIPGIGNLFVNAIQNLDVFLLCGAVVVYCSLLIAFNVLVDLVYGLIDPRLLAASNHG